MRHALALLLVTLLGTSAHAGVLDLTAGMSVAQVKQSGICHKAVVDRALMTCRATQYAGRVMAFEILIPDDRLSRVVLTANLGANRSGAEKIVASIFATLEGDFSPLQFTDGTPVTPAALFTGDVPPSFVSDSEAKHGRVVFGTLARTARGFALELTIFHKPVKP